MPNLIVKLRLTIKNKGTGETLTIPVEERDYFESKESVLFVFSSLTDEVEKRLVKRLGVFELKDTGSESLDKFT